MSERAAEVIWAGVGAYAGLGAVVALLLLFFGGLRRIDATAAVAPLRVKVLIAPGLVALWPLMLLRLAGVRPGEDKP